MSTYQSKYTFCMHTRTTRRRVRLQKQTFSIWRPYWISRLAIIYPNLCRQFQKLQRMGNILVYDTPCCMGWGVGPGSQFFSLESHPTIPRSLVDMKDNPLGFSPLWFEPRLGHMWDSQKKKVREKSRECHNHKPQPFPDAKRKRKPTNPNKH